MATATQQTLATSVVHRLNHVFHLSRLPTDRNQGLAFRPYEIHPKPIPNRLIVGDHPLFPRPLDKPEPPASHVNQTMIEIYRERRILWALLLTCRQVYNEAIEILFRDVTLRLDDPHVLLDLRAHYIPQRHFRAVKKLEIIWRCKANGVYSGGKLAVRGELGQLTWDRLWRLIKEEMQLSSLQVWIIITIRHWLLTQGAPWINFVELRGIPQCRVWVSMHDGPREIGASLEDLIG
ncbi:MAG: hypothetical protein L6R41_001393 [Letrouitia leprolyta]|nr:MAG: hypothetical protein L6R41_001393 [Letrouitia leprolyta]